MIPRSSFYKGLEPRNQEPMIAVEGGFEPPRRS